MPALREVHEELRSSRVPEVSPLDPEGHRTGGAKTRIAEIAIMAWMHNNQMLGLAEQGIEGLEPEAIRQEAGEAGPIIRAGLKEEVLQAKAVEAKVKFRDREPVARGEIVVELIGKAICAQFVLQRRPERQVHSSPLNSREASHSTHPRR